MAGCASCEPLNLEFRRIEPAPDLAAHVRHYWVLLGGAPAEPAHPVFPDGCTEIVFNPSATVAGLSEYLWRLEQPAHAVANAFFVGAINRVGYEDPWRIGEFYGQSYFCNPRGQIVAEAARDRDELVTAELDLDQIREVRNVWQFYRDRRPETYVGIPKP